MPFFTRFIWLLVVFLSKQTSKASASRSVNHDHFKAEAFNVVNSGSFKGLRDNNQMKITSQQVVYAHPSDGGFENIFENIEVKEEDGNRYNVAGLARLCREDDNTVRWLHQMAVQCGATTGTLTLARYERSTGTWFLLFDTTTVLQLCRLTNADIRAALTLAARDCASAFQGYHGAEELQSQCTSVLHATTCQDVIQLVKTGKAMRTVLVLQPPVNATRILAFDKTGPCKITNNNKNVAVEDHDQTAACKHVIANGITSMGFDQFSLDGTHAQLGTIAILKSGTRGFVYLLSSNAPSRLLLTQSSPDQMIRVERRKKGTVLQVSLTGKSKETIKQKSFHLQCTALPDCETCTSKAAVLIDSCTWCYYPHNNTGSCVNARDCKGNLPSLSLKQTCPPVITHIAQPKTQDKKSIVLHGSYLNTSLGRISRVGFCGQSCAVNRSDEHSLTCQKPTSLSNPTVCPISLYWKYQIHSNGSTIEVPIPYGRLTSTDLKGHAPVAGSPGNIRDGGTRDGAGDEHILGNVRSGGRIKKGTYVILVATVSTVAFLALVIIIILLACRKHGCIWFGKVVKADDVHPNPYPTYIPVPVQSGQLDANGLPMPADRRYIGSNSTESHIDITGMPSHPYGHTSDGFTNPRTMNSVDNPLTEIHSCGGGPFESLRQYLLQQDPDIVIHRDQLEIDLSNRIGEGNFGVVYKGVFRVTDRAEARVAVKTIKVCDDDPLFYTELKKCANLRPEVIKDFLREGKRMKDFKHPHVMRLTGISFGSGDDSLPYIVTPFMDNGDLAKYLKGRKGLMDVPLADMLRFASQIASGLEYLHSQRFIHRDLACRNCMLDEKLNVRISDFGLCRDVYESNIYLKPRETRGTSAVPLRWMPLESIQDGVYDAKSDVWSFGVTMWEIWSYSSLPYCDTLNGLEVIGILKNGQRLDQPDRCPDEIYQIMRHCWNCDPKERPNVAILGKQLQAITHLLTAPNAPGSNVNYAHLRNAYTRSECITIADPSQSSSNESSARSDKFDVSNRLIDGIDNDYHAPSSSTDEQATRNKGLRQPLIASVDLTTARKVNHPDDLIIHNTEYDDDDNINIDTPRVHLAGKSSSTSKSSPTSEENTSNSFDPDRVNEALMSLRNKPGSASNLYQIGTPNSSQSSADDLDRFTFDTRVHTKNAAKSKSRETPVFGADSDFRDVELKIISTKPPLPPVIGSRLEHPRPESKNSNTTASSLDSQTGIGLVDKMPSNGSLNYTETTTQNLPIPSSTYDRLGSKDPMKSTDNSNVCSKHPDSKRISSNIHPSSNHDSSNGFIDLSTKRPLQDGEEAFWLENGLYKT